MIVPSPAAKTPVAILQTTERKPWQRLKFAIAAALFAGLALSPRLWLSSRLFPFTPVLRGLPPIPPPFDWVVYGLLLTALAAIAFLSKPARWVALFTGLILMLAVSDQMRWQPWVYQYMWMLGAVGLYAANPGKSASDDAASNGEKYRLVFNVCRLVVACTYFWSGVQKVNAAFVDRVFPFLVQPLLEYIPQLLLPVVNAGAYAAPVVETAVGIGLLFPRTRRFAVVAGICMHAFILLAIGPLGRNYNSVVWPWNLAMVTFLILLFGSNSRSIGAREILWPERAFYPKLVLLMVGLVPSLSLFNLWDSYLSFALYSGSANSARIEMPNAFADRLPKPVLYHVFVGKVEGTTEMNFQEWSLDELNVPLNPERRIYKSLSRYLCPYEKKPGEAVFHIYEDHHLFAESQQFQYSCAALAAD